MSGPPITTFRIETDLFNDAISSLGLAWTRLESRHDPHLRSLREQIAALAANPGEPGQEEIDGAILMLPSPEMAAAIKEARRLEVI